jgi:hypothetical protein
MNMNVNYFILMEGDRDPAEVRNKLEELVNYVMEKTGFVCVGGPCVVVRQEEEGLHPMIYMYQAMQSDPQ